MTLDTEINRLKAQLVRKVRQVDNYRNASNGRQAASVDSSPTALNYSRGASVPDVSSSPTGTSGLAAITQAAGSIASSLNTIKSF